MQTQFGIIHQRYTTDLLIIPNHFLPSLHVNFKRDSPN